MPSADKVIHPGFPSLEIKLVEGRLESEGITAINLKISDDDRDNLLTFLEENGIELKQDDTLVVEGMRHEGIEFVNEEKSETSNAITLEGDQAEQFAALILNSNEFTLPTATFYNLAKEFGVNEDRLKNLLEQQRSEQETLNALNLKLSSVLPPKITLMDIEQREEDKDVDKDVEVEYEIDDGIMQIFDDTNAFALDLIKQIDQSNQELRQTIEENYAAVEKHINERNKITIALQNFCRFVSSLVSKNEVHLAKKDAQELGEKCKLPPPPARSYVSAKELKDCNAQDFEKNINEITGRYHNKTKTVEEKTRATLQWIATKCKPAFEYALSKSSAAVRAIVTAALTMPSPRARSASIFSPKQASESNSSPDTPKPRPRSNTG